MTVKKSPFMRTHYHTKKAVQRITDVTIPQGTPTNTESTKSAPGSGTSTTKQPIHLKDIPVGIRYGYIDKIDYSRSDAYKYHVVFPDTKTDTWAKKIGQKNIKSINETTLGKNLIVLEEKIDVALSVEYNSLTWVIIGEIESDNVPESGTFNIIQGDKFVTLSNDYIKIGVEDSYIEIKDNEINIISNKVKINGEEI